MKVIDLAAPQAGDDEVLLKLEYVGFCGSDLSTFRGGNPMVRIDGLAQCQEMVGEVLQAVGQLVLVGNPLEVILDGFLLTQVAADAQNHLVECFLGTLQGLLFHELTGTDVPSAPRAAVPTTVAGRSPRTSSS